jgi:hypothetical protein
VSVDVSGVCPLYVRRMSAGQWKSDATPDRPADRPPDGPPDRGRGLNLLDCLADDVLSGVRSKKLNMFNIPDTTPDPDKSVHTMVLSAGQDYRVNTTLTSVDEPLSERWSPPRTSTMEWARKFGGISGRLRPLLNQIFQMCFHADIFANLLTTVN